MINTDDSQPQKKLSHGNIKRWGNSQLVRWHSIPSIHTCTHTQQPSKAKSGMTFPDYSKYILNPSSNFWVEYQMCPEPLSVYSASICVIHVVHTWLKYLPSIWASILENDSTWGKLQLFFHWRKNSWEEWKIYDMRGGNGSLDLYIRLCVYSQISRCTFLVEWWER